LENSNQRIQIEAKQPDDVRVSSFSPFIVTSPYRSPRGASVDTFNNMQRTLANLAIGEFIDDAPASLVPYGLDKPGRLYIESPKFAVTVYFGYGSDGRLYVKLPDKPWVFTAPDLEKLVTTKAFDIIDRFILIYNIDKVNDFTVSGDGLNLRADIRGTKENPDFFINGQKAAEKEFRAYYQSLIGLVLDAEYPGPQGKTAEGSTITITFNLKEPVGSSASVTLIPYNRDFYSVTKEGITEFLVSRSQVQKILNSADKMAYE
jgi:hypothetical protein